MEKNKLLSIGEFSKITGASIRSLRYYESLKLLEPAHTDGNSGYRYYSSDQAYLAIIIKYCIELDIPLKDLSRFIDKSGTFNFSGFIAQGKKTAVQKLETINKGLALLGGIEKAMELAETYEVGKIYEREIEEKRFFLEPCEKPEMNAEMHFKFEGLYSKLYRAEAFYSSLPENGFFYIYKGGSVQRYIFLEILQNEARKEEISGVASKIKTVPAGLYLCRQSEESQIESALEIMGERLRGQPPVFAIETDIFTGKFKISSPVCELRVFRGVNNAGANPQAGAGSSGPRLGDSIWP